MSDYPMLISNKLHSFRNFYMQIYEKIPEPDVRREKSPVRGRLFRRILLPLCGSISKTTVPTETSGCGRALPGPADLNGRL